MPLDKSNNYFFLNEDCFLIKGAKRGAIYNVTSGEVFSINPIMTDFLDKCENKKSLKQILNNNIPKNIKKSEIINYLNELEKLRLGDFYENKVAIIKIMPIKSDSVIEKLSSLNFIWLKVTEECNLNCVHCNKKNIFNYRIPSCNLDRRKKDIDTMSFSDWQRVIKDIDFIGCNTLQFIGGEPLLFSKKIIDLIKVARNLSYKRIELFTNGTLLDKKLINYLVKNEVITITPLFSSRSEIHDNITRTVGSFEKTLFNLKKLKAEGGKIFFHLIILKNNQNYIEETIKFSQELDIEIQNYSIDYSCNFEKIGTFIPENFSLPFINRPHFKPIGFSSFFKRIEVNECCDGKIAIINNGKVFPCITSTKKELIGNVKKTPVIELLRNQDFEKYWKENKDKIDVCNQCEYRYACFHCRILEKNFFNTWKSTSKFCTYNPISGIWIH